MSKIANLPKTENDLGWHSCFPKIHLTKHDLDRLIYSFNYGNIQSGIYLLKVTKETLEQGVRYVQS